MVEEPEKYISDFLNAGADMISIHCEARGDHNTTIKKIQATGKKAEETLKFSFEYKVWYEPKIGNILLEGHFFYVDEQKKIKEILTNWKKDKKIAQPLMQQLMNNIIIKCSIKALTLSQDVNLPPHIPLPTVRPQGKRPEDYIG